MSKAKTRPATEVDRKAATDALKRAGISQKDVSAKLNAFPEKWNLKQCIAVMLEAGMTGEEIDAALAVNDPTKADAQ